MAGDSDVFGDFPALELMIKRMRDPQRALRQYGWMVASAVKAEYVSGFDQGRSPYGGPWAPRKRKAGHQPMVKTGAMRNAPVEFITGKNAVRITSTPYARFHQYGARAGMPRRSTMPFDEDSTWDRPIETAIIECFVRHFGGS